MERGRKRKLSSWGNPSQRRSLNSKQESVDYLSGKKPRTDSLLKRERSHNHDSHTQTPKERTPISGKPKGRQPTRMLNPDSSHGARLKTRQYSRDESYRSPCHTRRTASAEKEKHVDEKPTGHSEDVLQEDKSPTMNITRARSTGNCPNSSKTPTRQSTNSPVRGSTSPAASRNPAKSARCIQSRSLPKQGELKHGNTKDPTGDMDIKTAENQANSTERDGTSNMDKSITTTPRRERSGSTQFVSTGKRDSKANPSGNREMKNLEDSWSEPVSQLRTRSQSESSSPSKRTRRQIRFPAKPMSNSNMVSPQIQEINRPVTEEEAEIAVNAKKRNNSEKCILSPKKQHVQNIFASAISPRINCSSCPDVLANESKSNAKSTPSKRLKLRNGSEPSSPTPSQPTTPSGEDLLSKPSTLTVPCVECPKSQATQPDNTSNRDDLDIFTSDNKYPRNDSSSKTGESQMTSNNTANCPSMGKYSVQSSSPNANAGKTSIVSTEPQQAAVYHAIPSTSTGIISSESESSTISLNSSEVSESDLHSMEQSTSSGSSGQSETTLTDSAYYFNSSIEKKDILDYDYANCTTSDDDDPPGMRFTNTNTVYTHATGERSGTLESELACQSNKGVNSLTSVVESPPSLSFLVPGEVADAADISETCIVESDENLVDGGDPKTSTSRSPSEQELSSISPESNPESSEDLHNASRNTCSVQKSDLPGKVYERQLQERGTGKGIPAQSAIKQYRSPSGKPGSQFQSCEATTSTSDTARSIENILREETSSSRFLRWYKDRTVHDTVTSDESRNPTKPRSKSVEILRNVPTTSKLMSILTAEHDYFKRDPPWLVRTMGPPLGEKSDGIYNYYRQTPQQVTNYELFGTVASPNPGRFAQRSETSSNDAKSDFNAEEGPNHSIDSVVGSLFVDERLSEQYACSSEDDKSLGFNISDFVIRRRRLRSESTKEELWEGIPSVTPFRKLVNKLKDKDDIDSDIEGLPNMNTSNYEDDPRTTSTAELINDMDAMLTDTTGSTSRFGNNGMFSCETASRDQDQPSATDCPPAVSPGVSRSVCSPPALSCPEGDRCRDHSANWASSVEYALESSPGMQPVAQRDNQDDIEEVAAESKVDSAHGNSCAAIDEKTHQENSITDTDDKDTIATPYPNTRYVPGSECTEEPVNFDSGSFHIGETEHDSDEVDDKIPKHPVTDSDSKTEYKSPNHELVLWSKKRDKKRVFFPKIVLRKCKRSVRYNPRDCSTRKSTFSRDRVKPVGSSTALTSSCVTPKRSARLLSRADSSFSCASTRSTDFVYTPLKRDDSKSQCSPVKKEDTKCRSSKAKRSPGREYGSNIRSSNQQSPGRRGRSKAGQLKPRTNPERRSRCQGSTFVTASFVTEDSSEADSIAEVKEKPKKRAKKDNAKSGSGGGGNTRDVSTIPNRRESYIKSSLKNRKKKATAVDEKLMTNPEVDKHACILWSSEHRRHFQMASPDISSTELDEVLRQHWCQKMTLSEKVKYFTRARDALRDEDKHTKRVGREKRSGKTGSIMAKLDNEMSSLELFTHLKTRRQKDLLTKWLHFFQKVLSRKEYAEFIEEVKQGILEAEAKDKPHKNRGLTSKIFSHKKLLFLKMEKLKDHVMHEYCRRKRREKDFRKLAYHILVSRLIRGKPCAFIKGCRSRKLSRALQDLQDMEYGDSVAVLGYPIETSSFTSLYREIVETVDSCMFRDDMLEKGENLLAVTSKTCTRSGYIVSEERSEVDGEAKGGTQPPTTSDTVVASEYCPANQTVPEDVRTNDGGAENMNHDARNNNKTNNEIPEDVLTTFRAPRDNTPECFSRLVNDNAVAAILDGLRKVTELPELNRNTLDAIFLPPPARLPVFGPSGQQVLHAEKTITMSSPNTVQGWKSLARPPKIRYEPMPVGRNNSQLSYSTRRSPTGPSAPLNLSVPHVPGGRQQMMGAADITTGVPPGFPVQQMMFPRHSNPDHSKMFPSVSSALPGSLLPVGAGSIYGHQSFGGSMRVHGTNPHGSIGRHMQTANGSPMMPSYRHFLSSTARPPGILHSHLGMYRGSSQIPIAEILHAEARDAFNRSYTSNTDPCCEMDSPSCALSTWVAADNSNRFEKQFD